MAAQNLHFKLASEDSEFEQIHRLNYRTFVEEIPQHEPDPTGRRVDKFHPENTYIVGKDGERVVAMIALRDKRPFSLDLKLGAVDPYIPAHSTSPVEIRLLAIEKDYRKTRLFFQLTLEAIRLCQARGYDLALISGTTRQLKLYRQLGFVPFADMVGTDDAKFQPMYLTADLFEAVKQHLKSIGGAMQDGRAPVNFLPGPVTVRPAIRRAMGGAPISHRSAQFYSDFARVQSLLCALTGARQVELMMGSGTCGNDAVAGQISLLGKRGLVLVNGEFGRRLVDHATRWGLDFDVLEGSWGDVFEVEALRAALDRDPQPRWLWAAHCETSTGVLNDLALMRSLCEERGIRLALDCTSSIGTVRVDLRGVWIASTASGKGLASLPGIVMVFHNEEVRPAPTRLPRYFDLGYYSKNDGIPFTISSNQVYALLASLEGMDWSRRFEEIASQSRWLIERIRERGWRVPAPELHRAPAVITLELPRSISSLEAGRKMEELGFWLSYRSAYLVERNWMQVCLYSEFQQADLEELLAALDGVPGSPAPAAPERAASQAR